MDRLRGVMTAIVTPFDERGALNLAVLPAFLEFQRAAGVDGVVVAGTNGEGTSLSVDERKRLFDAALEYRGDLTVLAGTGAASVADAVELSRYAGRAGADAVLVLPPFYYKNPRPEGVARYFRTILDATDASDVPVLLYSIPQQSAVPIADDILDLLAGHPRLAGLKDSAGQWDRTHALITGRPGLKVFPGSDELLGRALGAGAVGAISGTANAFPELIVAVKRAVESGGNVEAAQARLNAAKTILLDYPLIAASKSALAHRGVPRMWVRPPLVELTADQEREMMARLRDAGLV